MSVSIVVTQVPQRVFEDEAAAAILVDGYKAKQVVWLKSFRRVIMIFETADQAHHFRFMFDNTCPWDGNDEPIRTYPLDVR
jgi:hypothetical protein